AYSEFLHNTPLLLWGTRIVLLGAVGAHLWASFQLSNRNLGARGERYKKKQDVATSYAAKTMLFSGPILLFFILYHLAHLTFGMTNGVYEFDPHHVYNNLVYGFQQWWISAIYIVGNLALGLHLYHGAWAMFSSVGLTHPRYDRMRETVAIVLVAFVVVANLSFPIMVLIGAVPPAPAFTTLD